MAGGLVRNGDRMLRVDVTGDPDGAPVFLLHGTPGSHQGPKPRNIVLHRMGVRLIAYDRPGYGESDRHPGRRVADAAGDVAAIADELGLNSFAVAGRSGGGPHALACAALLPGRVTKAAVLVSTAPPTAAGLDWYGGMHEVNTAARDRDVTSADYEEDIRRRVDDIRADPEALLKHLEGGLTGTDRRVVDDLALRRLLLSNYREAFLNGPYGWIDDTVALRRDWGFTLDSIGTRVRLWHGEADEFAPISHTRWLASRLPNVETVEDLTGGHFTALEILPELLAWLVESPADSGRVPVSTGSGRGSAG